MGVPWSTVYLYLVRPAKLIKVALAFVAGAAVGFAAAVVYLWVDHNYTVFSDSG